MRRTDRLFEIIQTLRDGRLHRAQDLARAALALAVLVGLGWLLSSNRRAVPWRMVGWGIGLQILLAVLVQEKLLIPIQGKKRSHEPVSPEEFRDRVQKMVSGKGKPKAASRKKSPAARKKAQLKKRAAPATGRARFHWRASPMPIRISDAVKIPHTTARGILPDGGSVTLQVYAAAPGPIAVSPTPSGGPGSPSTG